MAFAGDQHGGAGKNAGEVRKMAGNYVDARIEGKAPREAAREAGYSDNTPIHQIERAGGPVHNLMAKALAERGIDEKFLAAEYLKGIEESKQRGAKEADYGAHAKYLLQIGYLLGYGKQGPSVAVQINNNDGPARKDDIERLKERMRRAEELLALFEGESGKRQSAGVLEGDPDAAGGDQVLANPEACPGVDPLGPDTPEALGGGQP